MRYLLDTNIVIAVLNRRSDITIARLAARRADVAMSAIVAFELSYGAYNSAKPIENLRRMYSIDLPILELTTADGVQAGCIRAALRAAGTPIGHYDVLIAGQALARDMTVVTNNTGEFARVAGLKLEDWTAP
ncbi:type II toxin-antitoxin system VapC family toxin [Sphingomonas bacterium]|uniref:type II toxin-antitoxin system VapC family toxin n=1 Tax=Sphingomonas bacterium TaxID=1895847 RepID=UPI001C2D37F9|nr:type II toxin-antitoxin system VapC family toxin [Sphingomonas bacterium]